MSLITLKDWRDSPDSSTPLSAAAIEDIETRVETGLELAADYLDRDYQQAGILAVGPLSAISTVTPTANRAYAQRFVPTRAMAITLMAFENTTAAGANDNVDVGIYSAALSRLGSSGATAGKLNATAGIQTVNLTGTVNLLPGVVYYAAWSAGTFGGTAVVIRSLAYNTGFTPRLFGGTGAPQWETLQMDTAHPLPVTFVPTTSPSTPPLLAVRES